MDHGDAARDAYARALRRLARRDHSEAEIRTALRRAGFDEPVIEAVVERLRGLKYLDDAGFAVRLARSRLRHAGLGRHRVRQELRRKGVAPPAAEAGLREALAEVDEADAVDALARRYWRTRTADEPRCRLQKLWAFLVRRGFPSALVHDRLHALWPRWSDALEGLEPAPEE